MFERKNLIRGKLMEIFLVLIQHKSVKIKLSKLRKQKKERRRKYCKENVWNFSLFSLFLFSRVIIKVSQSFSLFGMLISYFKTKRRCWTPYREKIYFKYICIKKATLLGINVKQSVTNVIERKWQTFKWNQNKYLLISCDIVVK